MEVRIIKGKLLFTIFTDVLYLQGTSGTGNSQSKSSHKLKHLDLYVISTL